MKILITGFAGSNENMNASGELISSFSKILPDEMAPLKSRLCFEILNCQGDSPEEESAKVKNELNRIISQHNPTLCLFTGQAPMYNRIRIERFATNFFLGKPIDESAPTAYPVTLPRNKELPDLLNTNKIPAGHSNYAGQHTCNHILFSALHKAEYQHLEVKAGFVHIPVLPEQVASASEYPFRDSPFMTLEQTRLAIAHVVNHVARKAGL